MHDLDLIIYSTVTLEGIHRALEQALNNKAVEATRNDAEALAADDESTLVIFDL